VGEGREGDGVSVLGDSSTHGLTTVSTKSIGRAAGRRIARSCTPCGGHCPDGREGEARRLIEPKRSTAPRVAPRGAETDRRASPSRRHIHDTTAKASAGPAGTRAGCGPRNERPSPRNERIAEDFWCERDVRATSTRTLCPFTRPGGLGSPRPRAQVEVVGWVGLGGARGGPTLFSRARAGKVPAPQMHLCTRSAQQSAARASLTHRGGRSSQS
jgi:hypothetical protein